MLLLVTDQERYDVSAPDGPAVETPILDGLAAEGMRFTRAYTPISICSSARASLLSGRYPHDHGMLNNCHEADAVRPNFPADVATFGELLADAGYENSSLGKWHVGRDQTPADFGFDPLGVGNDPAGADDAAFREYRRRLGVDPDGDHLEDEIHVAYEEGPTLVAARTTVPAEATYTHYLAERTVERLRDLADGGREDPFLHRTDFPGPHHPYVVPEPYASMYDPDDVVRWASLDETFDGKPRVHEQYLEYRGVSSFDRETWAEVVSYYFGFVTFVDDRIGRILEAVEDLGLADGTMVVHTSDHGDFTGSHRQFNKGPMMYEDTYRVPLFVRWPGAVEAGATCESFVRLLDLMPTFLDAAGVDPPADVAGRSLFPLLSGDRPDDWPDSVFAEYHGDEFGLYSQRMVRDDRFKFVYNAPDVNELYDLRADPAELHNLAGHPDYESVLTGMKRLLVSWMARTDDPIEAWTRRALGVGTT